MEDTATVKRSADMKDEDINLLIILPETGSGQGPYYLMAENGEVLASHFCSNSSFAKGDLHDRRTERKEEYSKRFGEYEVKFVDETDIEPEELQELNKAHAELNGYLKKDG